MRQQNKYEKLFDEFLELTEFRLVRHQNDYDEYSDEYGHWSLIDSQGANLGDIEGDRFENAAQILDRMDIYIRDYLIESIEDILEDEFDIDTSNYSNWSDLLELAKKYLSYDYGWSIDILDMICNHFDEINLENCTYEEENNMKTWKIPVVWKEMGVVKVEANTLAEAIEIARDDDGVIPIPDNGEFLDGTWEVDCFDEEYLRKFYNDNQKDDEREDQL